jgi:hypothetical protein
MEAYQAALLGETAPHLEIGVRRTKPGTIAALTVGYFNSLAFHCLAPETMRTRRNILERFRTEHGDKRIALLQRAHIEKMVVAKAATPAAARNFINTIRSLLQFAVDSGVRPDNPAIGVKRVKIKTDGYRTWTEGDIAAFEARHPVGTRARLALSLFALHGTTALRHRADGPTTYSRRHHTPQAAKNGGIVGDSGASDSAGCSRSYPNRTSNFPNDTSGLVIHGSGIH